MKLQFDSVSDFIAMGGHGPFVWSVYAITIVVLVYLVLSPIRKSRQFWKEQAMRERRNQGSSDRFNQ